MASTNSPLIRIVDFLKMNSAFGLAILFFLSLAAFAFRNLEPLAFPVLYAEDATWLGSILREGWVAASFSVRDFPVVGLVGLQALALFVCDVLYGGDLAAIPYCYFWVSNIFLAAVAVCVFVSARGLPIHVRISMLLAVVCMPLGGDGGEVFGRILNIGFVFPVMQCAIIAWSERVERYSISRDFVSALVSLVCALTFPVGIGLAGGAVALRIFRLSRREKGLKDNWIGLAALVSSFLFVLLIFPYASLLGKGGADLVYSSAGFVEFSIARPLLYPWVAIGYKLLRDPMVIAALAVGVAVAGFGLGRRVGCNGVAALCTAQSVHVVVFGYGFFLYYAATVVMRSGFTSVFGTYQSSFPDRYFYGLNILFVCFSLVFVSTFFERSWSRAWSALTCAALILFALVSGSVFEGSKPSMQFREFGTFGYSLCQSLRTGSGVAVPPVLNGHILKVDLPADRLARSQGRCP